MSTLSSSASGAAHRAFQSKQSTTSTAPEEILAKRRHPRFNLMEKHWRFCIESYQGGPEYLYKGLTTAPSPGTRSGLAAAGERNLFKYFKEGAEEYQERLVRSHRNNYSKKVVDQIRAFIARKPPERQAEGTPDEVKRFWRNADGHGRDIDRSMALAMQWAGVFGLVWIVVDKPNTTSEARDEELESGMPFMRHYFPYDVMDASYDAMGELNWVIFREHVRVDDDPMGPAPIQTHLLVWDRQQVRRFIVVMDKDEVQGTERIVARLDTTSPHELGFVPARTLRFTDSDDPFIAAGLLDDVAYLDRSIYNKESLLDTIIYDQTFSQLVIPTDAVVLNAADRTEGAQGVDVVESSRQKTRQRVQEMGTKRVFLFNGQTNHAPRYISPDATQAQVIRNTISDEIEEVYRITGLRQEIGREVRTQSGVSKAYDFDKLNKVLSFIAQEMELTDKWQAAVVQRWLAPDDGKLDLEAVDDIVQYPRNFDIMGLLEEIDIAIRAEDLNLYSPTADAELRRRVVRKLFAGVPENAELLQVITTEIDSYLEKRKQVFERDPLDPLGIGEGGEGPARRGLGGGAPGPGNGPPGPPTTQQADAGAAGMN